ncbi:Inositol 2-dehydrogenase [Gemmata sp. SH-PL17]|uniref:Gfo/Idh/MocA family protein n=1 Tax=Gemmata sp. SH-PL17 TaxID=1630693 RepID=UPI00078ED17C|nr:Gfo/Idh/MocA family oxidoreductase [Gemmata sp. SH-PL17]AMV26035.1 Inositol 2-dehydrogenase [Gemmata sp. SH-PL17]
MSDTTRRAFIQTSAATAATASLLPGAFAAGDGTLKVGLIGCGNRGTGAAREALQSDPKVKLVAMADAFMDRLEDSLTNLSGIKSIAGKVDVPKERRFDGFDGYKKVIESDVDVVLLTTPPGFRPLHLEAAIKAGKHVFCEKPVAVDAAGVRSVIATSKLAKEKNLSLCSGFCYRYDLAKRETVKRIHSGMIGDVAAMHVTYLTGSIWHRGNDPKWSPMEFQMRNWYYFTWLSGDFIVEQHCHNFDKAHWVFGKLPVSATAVGGRQVRRDPKFGYVYDHFGATLEYENGAKLFSFCRQTDGCDGDVNDHVMGTKGSAQLMDHTVTPTEGKGWAFGSASKVRSMYQVEHDELFAGIRSGKHINDGESAAHSTLMAIMAREAAYTGKKITWADALNAKQNLSPKEYAWGPIATPLVPMPGTYRFS